MAIGYLGRREYAAMELQRKLSLRGVDAAIAETVVAELVAENLVSDRRYAEAWVRQRVQKGYGPSRIRGELRQRGVDESLAAEVLAEAAGDDEAEMDWHQQAREWAERRHRGVLDEKARARLYRAGLNRGFSHDQVMRAIDHLRSLASGEE